MEQILSTKGVSFSYDKKRGRVIDDLSLEIEKGKKTAILGANGAGKSTLFSILNALRKPDDGIVYYDGSPLSYRHRGVIRMRSEVSILYQNPNDMMFRPYVEQDVAFGPQNMKLSKDEVEERVQEALFAVGMTEYRKTPIMKLSYGQRKRITLAGVLAMRPKVLIMDEPTAGLDSQMAFEVMEIAEQLNASGVTVILSSHDNNLTYPWADYVNVLHEGKNVYSGEPERFYSDESLVMETGMLPPAVFTINKDLADSGAFDIAPYPKTVAEMAAKLSAGNIDPGTLHIVGCGPDVDCSGIGEDGRFDGMPSGVYGIKARLALSDAGRNAGYMFNGIDYTVRECLAGNDAVLFCDPDMIGFVESFVRNLSRFSSAGVSTDILDRHSD